MDREVWQATVHGVAKTRDMTEQPHLPTHLLIRVRGKGFDYS